METSLYGIYHLRERKILLELSLLREFPLNFTVILENGFGYKYLYVFVKFLYRFHWPYDLKPTETFGLLNKSHSC